MFEQPPPHPLVKLIIEGIKPWLAHPLVSTKAKHPQHTLGGQSPLLWTPEADGHLGLFLHMATCVKECLDTPRMASRKRVTICCPKGQLYKEDGFRHASSHVYKSAWMKTGQPPLGKKSAWEIGYTIINDKATLVDLLHSKVKHPSDWRQGKEKIFLLFNVKRFFYIQSPLAKE